MENDYNYGGQPDNGYDPNAGVNLDKNAYDSNAGYDPNAGYNPNAGYDSNAQQGMGGTYGTADNNGYTDQSGVDSFGNPIQNMGGYGVPQNQGTPVLAIVSMILGILATISSTVCCCFYGFIAGIPLGIAALITGFINTKKQAGGKGMSIAGMITGAVGLLAGIVVTVLFAIGVGASMMEGMSF